jgi:hypothetical protein
MAELDYAHYWTLATPWERYLEQEVREHRALWEGVWTRARIPEWALAAAARAGGPWRLLVISEDWCGDASNTVPVVARLAAELPERFAVRVLRRDRHPELIERHLTQGSRSIPLVLALDRAGALVGLWGPRPAELQRFILREKAAGERSVGDIYRDARAWYARDRGESTLRELLAVLGGEASQAAA